MTSDAAPGPARRRRQVPGDGRCRLSIWTLLAVFALALTVRAGFVAAAPLLYDSYISDHYDFLAHNMLAGDGLTFRPSAGPTLRRSAAFPLAIAAVYLATGSESVTPVRIVAVVGDSLTAAMLVALAAAFVPTRLRPFGLKATLRGRDPDDDEWLSGDDRVWRSLPVAAGIVYALQPYAAHMAAMVVIDTLMAFLLVAACLLATLWLKTARWSLAVSLGLVLGLAAWTKSPALGLPPLAAVTGFTLLRRRGTRPRTAVLQACVILFVAAAVLAPWTVRNWRLTHAFVPVQTMTWENFWIVRAHRTSGNPWPDLSKPVPGLDPAVKLSNFPFQTAVENLEAERQLRRQAVSWIRANPDDFAAQIAANLVAFWAFVDTRSKNAAMLLLLAVQLPFVVAAIVWARRRDAHGLFALCLGPIAYFWLVYSPVVAHARYSVTVLPLLSVVVAAGVLVSREWWRDRRAVGGASGESANGRG